MVGHLARKANSEQKFFRIGLPLNGFSVGQLLVHFPTPIETKSTETGIADIVFETGGGGILGPVGSEKDLLNLFVQ